MEKSPAFQFYPSDWLRSIRVAEMSLEEEGAYIRSLAYAWGNNCCIPSNPEKLARIIGKGGSTTVATTVQKMYEPHPTDNTLLIHPRLLREKEKQDKWRQKSAEGGKKSGKARAKRVSKGSMKGGSRVVQPPYEPKPNFSFSSSNKTKFTNVNLVTDPNKESEKSKEETIKKPTRLFEVCDLYFQAQRYIASGGKERCKLQDQSKEFIESFIQRNAKSAKLLSPYSNAQIKRAINYCVELSAQSKADPEGGWDWTLETVGKKIDRVLSPNQVTHE